MRVIRLTRTEQLAFEALNRRSKDLHDAQGRLQGDTEAFMKELAGRTGVEPGEIGSKYLLTPDGLIPQE